MDPSNSMQTHFLATVKNMLEETLVRGFVEGLPPVSPKGSYLAQESPTSMKTSQHSQLLYASTVCVYEPKYKYMFLSFQRTL